MEWGTVVAIQSAWAESKKSLKVYIYQDSKLLQGVSSQNILLAISQQNTLMNNYTAKMSLVPDD